METVFLYKTPHNTYFFIYKFRKYEICKKLSKNERHWNRTFYCEIKIVETLFSFIKIWGFEKLCIFFRKKIFDLCFLISDQLERFKTEFSILNRTDKSFKKLGSKTYLSLARASGDPHYHTFDGKTIHYQGGCIYRLAGEFLRTCILIFRLYFEDFFA